MIDLGDFLDLCKERTNTVTDSNLARKIDVTRSSIALYRKGASFPSDAKMVMLAKRAKLDPEECLWLLGVWRTEGEAQEIYRGILKRLFPGSGFL